MQITIKGTDLDLTPAIKEYVDTKIGALDKFLQGWGEHADIEARVEVARTTNHHNKGNVYRAEVNLRLPGKLLRAEHEDWDIRVAIDQVANKLKREIVKEKELLERK